MAFMALLVRPHRVIGPPLDRPFLRLASTCAGVLIMSKMMPSRVRRWERWR